MGKGRIIEADGDGLYQVELVHDMAPLQDRHDELIESRAQLLQPLAEARHAADLARADAAGARAKLNEAIISGDQEWMQEAAIESARAAGVAYGADANYAALDAEHSAKTREIWTLETALTARDPVIACWCADYTVDLEPGTEVGTIDIPDEYNPFRPVIIQPAWRPDDPKIGAAWDCTRDGFLMRANAQGPYQAYYNAVMLPGLQKYRPYYRVADLLQVDGDTASIVIDREQSSASRSSAYVLYTPDAFHINPPGADTSDNALSFEAQIVYMDCNGSAFSAGDRVVVFFSGSWETPLVVGFETNPKPCDIPGGYLCQPRQGDPYQETGSPMIVRKEYGGPGAVSGPWQGEYRNDEWDDLFNGDPVGGEVDWRSGRIVISWRGIYTRGIPLGRSRPYGFVPIRFQWVEVDDTEKTAKLYYSTANHNSTDTFILRANLLQPTLFHNGKTLVSVPWGVVHGAAIQIVDDVSYLVALTSDMYDTGKIERLYSLEVNADLGSGSIEIISGKEWELRWQNNLLGTEYYTTDMPWFFSPDGSQARNMQLKSNFPENELVNRTRRLLQTSPGGTSITDLGNSFMIEESGTIRAVTCTSESQNCSQEYIKAEEYNRWITWSGNTVISEDYGKDGGLLTLRQSQTGSESKISGFDSVQDDAISCWVASSTGYETVRTDKTWSYYISGGNTLANFSAIGTKDGQTEYTWVSGGANIVTGSCSETSIIDEVIPCFADLRFNSAAFFVLHSNDSAPGTISSEWHYKVVGPNSESSTPVEEDSFPVGECEWPGYINDYRTPCVPSSNIDNPTIISGFEPSFNGTVDINVAMQTSGVSTMLSLADRQLTSYSQSYNYISNGDLDVIAGMTEDRTNYQPISFMLGRASF